jgi:glycosyltransferase involved in cell wall biosynthesis
MKQRLVILTEIIAPYRIPVFNALARHPRIDLKVVFLAETDPSIRQWRVYADEIQFHYEVLPSWRKRLGKYNLLLNQNLSEALQTANPDAILCGGYNYLASWQALRWAKRKRIPFLLWCESTADDDRAGHTFIESLKQKFFVKCDGFVVPGTSARNYVGQMAVNGKRIFTAPNAVDNDLFASRARSARINEARVREELRLPLRYFFFAGRLVKAKGVFELLEAYGSLSPELRSQIGLVFAGDGPLRADLERVAESIHPGVIHFAGFVQRDELASYYSLANCVVLPTHSDTWGMVVNEAMACGLPVICSEAAGCAADLIKENGRIVAPQNVFQLTRAMDEIATDAALREEMSRESRKIIQRYSPELCAAGIAEAALSCLPNTIEYDVRDALCEPNTSSPSTSRPQSAI